MPPFFIPAAEGAAETDQVYDAIVKFNQLTDPERFYSLNYRHEGSPRVATVGTRHYLCGEVVLAILKEKQEGAQFLICTANRGVVRGVGIMIRADSALTATRFTDE